METEAEAAVKAAKSLLRIPITEWHDAHEDPGNATPAVKTTLVQHCICHHPWPNVTYNHGSWLAVTTLLSYLGDIRLSPVNFCQFLPIHDIQS